MFEFDHVNLNPVRLRFSGYLTSILLKSPKIKVLFNKSFNNLSQNYVSIKIKINQFRNNERNLGLLYIY